VVENACGEPITVQRLLILQRTFYGNARSQVSSKSAFLSSHRPRVHNNIYTTTETGPVQRL